MKIFKSLLLGAASLALLTGCKDDFPVNGGNSDINDPNAPGVYMGVSFQMPGMTGTRSYTDGDDSSNHGTEVGTDIENNVNEVLLILARTNDYGFIGSATVFKDNLYKHVDGFNNGSYHATAKFSKSQLGQFYADEGIQNKGLVSVFVVANPTGGMKDALANAQYGNTEWINTPWHVNVTGSQTEGSIWTNTNGGSFLMTNSNIATRQIPDNELAWDNYTTEDNVFYLSETNGAVGSLDGIDNSTANNRGPVQVQRAAARFDFRDGSPDDTEANTYHAVYTEDENGNKVAPIIDITLNKMCLVNMNNTFYYMKRVSDNGLPTGANFTICGPERPWLTDLDGKVAATGNYVVDYFATQKSAGINSNFSNYFNYAFFEDDGSLNNANVQASDERWYVSQISDVLANGDKDNWDNSGNKGTYRVWRYLTENTIPGVEAQKNGISTGIVFKGKMKANKDLLVDLSKFTETRSAEYEDAYYTNLMINTINNENTGHPLHDTNQDPILYSYGGSLYITWQHVRIAAIRASFSWTYAADGKTIIPSWNRTNSLYKAVFGNGGTGYELYVGDKVVYTDELAEDETSPNYRWFQWNAAGKPATGDTKDTFKASATSAGITMYQSSEDNRDGWGYYCYYYYWNRHNDNGKQGIMGPMEFGVVRNNVYKLAVTKISTLGHPRITENDPDKPTPDTDDETSNVYLTVDAEVIPWVVRVNNIEFQ